MTTTVPAVVAVGEGLPLVVSTIERRDVGPRDVAIAIAYSGICHSDIHKIRGQWWDQHYPMVVGHEIVGTVTEVGAEVDGWRVGDLAGVGCMIGSCGECDNCRRGEEQYCTVGVVYTYASEDGAGGWTQGGYSGGIVVDAHFALHLPDALPLERIAPLLCAGITVYSPLTRWRIGPGTRVAIVGMGGLGHVGVKIAAALGAEVTVLSHSLAKQPDGLRFGASAYRATSDPATFTELAGRFDLILNTVAVDVDLESYLGLLTTGGVLVFVGLPGEPQGLPLFTLGEQRRIVTASYFGGIAETQEMLDFCAEHGIGAEVEVVGVDGIEAAFARVEASDVRYRFVIDVATLTAP